MHRININYLIYNNQKDIVECNYELIFLHIPLLTIKRFKVHLYPAPPLLDGGPSKKIQFRVQFCAASATLMRLNYSLWWLNQIEFFFTRSGPSDRERRVSIDRCSYHRFSLKELGNTDNFAIYFSVLCSLT